MFQDTRPAELDADGGADPWAPFRVSRPQECVALLRQLRDGQVPINLNGPDGSTLTTTLWSIDDKQSQLSFTADPGIPALDRLVEADEGVAVHAPTVADGWMHNRVRMIVASFLIKHLGIDWRRGEQWFRDTLVDADIASNAASWQWVAGSGADAAPFYRIFNPILQGKKFDPEGTYVRHFVPELASMPNDFLHCPFDAPKLILKTARIELGKDYPQPIVDHAKARDTAMNAYNSIKDAA